jgi:hypothetical protein
MARFTIKGNYLYSVSNSSLQTFNISNPSNINAVEVKNLGFGIETIFPTENNLFIGANNGMYIFKLDDPEDPCLLSFTQHFVSKDPVVANGNYAYVTLRDGFSAGGLRNALLVFDITNLHQPILLKEYQMAHPRGLGFENNKLFVCDDVLKVFNVSSDQKIELTKTFDIDAIDVIPADGKLYVIAEDGLYQYSYDGDNISLISKLVIRPKPE